MKSQVISAQMADGKAKTTKSTFNRKTTISIKIKAERKEIWKILTNAHKYPKWNSTIVSLEGSIEPGGKIRLKSTLDPKRTFKLKIKEYTAPRKLVWGDGKGNRSFTLKEIEGQVEVIMTEKIGGLMFPLYAKYIPPFDQSFEQFMNDLKQEAEKK
ncbi:MAG: SRPBCC domain-containing protein [Bacteroidota bacterium]